MEIERDSSVAFSGHRSCKLKALEQGLFDSNLTLEQQLEIEIINEINSGHTTFLSGMAEGFDMVAAECVLRIKQTNPLVRLISVIPFRGQYKQLSEEDRVRYSLILEKCDEYIILSEDYFAGCYNVRNNFLIDHSSVVITNFNGSKGGTEYTVKRAVRHRRRVVVLR